MKTEVEFEPNIQQAVPFFLVTDIEKSVRYYTNGLGFKMTRQWTPDNKLRWCRLERGGAALMLQEFGKDGPDGNLPSGKLGEGVSVYFICENALALYREFVSRGIEASRPFVGNGMWVTSLTDPNGYKIHFESLTDAPEESEYSES